MTVETIHFYDDACTQPERDAVAIYSRPAAARRRLAHDHHLQPRAPAARRAQEPVRAHRFEHQRLVGRHVGILSRQLDDADHAVRPRSVAELRARTPRTPGRIANDPKPSINASYGHQSTVNATVCQRLRPATRRSRARATAAAFKGALGALTLSSAPPFTVSGGTQLGTSALTGSVTFDADGDLASVSITGTLVSGNKLVVTSSAAANGAVTVNGTITTSAGARRRDVHDGRERRRHPHPRERDASPDRRLARHLVGRCRNMKATERTAANAAVRSAVRWASSSLSHRIHFGGTMLTRRLSLIAVAAAFAVSSSARDAAERAPGARRCRRSSPASFSAVAAAITTATTAAPIPAHARLRSNGQWVRNNTTGNNWNGTETAAITKARSTRRTTTATTTAGRRTADFRSVQELRRERAAELFFIARARCVAFGAAATADRAGAARGARQSCARNACTSRSRWTA